MKSFRKFKFLLMLVILLVETLCFSGCNFIYDITKGIFDSSKSDNSPYVSVHFIDVGQADSTLIFLPENKIMLIDAGSNKTGINVVSYLKSKQINKIDYLIGTHPHEDHIGGMDDVLNNFEVGSVYMPKVSAATKTFKDVLESVKNKNLFIDTAKAGVNIISNENLKVGFVAPNSDEYGDTNNYSAVLHMDYNGAKAIFMGDAEKESELEIVNNYKELKADLIKIGHHGSYSSTSQELLAQLSPKKAVISVGKNNSYGHPHDLTLKSLKDIEVYRTDFDTTIVFEYKNGKWEKK